MHSRASLTEDLRALGVRPGAPLVVHASLRATGPTEGAGPTERVLAGALRDALGKAGTLVVPAFTAGNSDTSRSYLRCTAGMTGPESARFRASMPPFDAERTESEGMGRLAEAVRRSPGAVRSAHPQTSFAALGPEARRLLEGHDETCHLGEESPLARLYEADARILLLNVGYEACSAFHLAEYRIPNHPRRRYRCVVLREGKAQWFSYLDAVLNDCDFGEVGDAYEKSKNDLSGHWVRKGKVGWADSRLLPLRGVVDFAVGYLAEKRC